jgi:hypothetical protein
MIHRNFLLSWLVIVLTAGTLWAQEIPPLQADRPDQTETPAIVPRGFLQAENGFSFERTDHGISTVLHPAILWKYGVHPRWELRVITDFATEEHPSGRQTGMYPLSFGIKTILLDEKGIIPQTSFIGHLTTSRPGSRSFRTKHPAPAFRFTMQHTLSQRLSLGYNLGTEWDGESPGPVYIYTLVTGITLSDKVGSYLEIYGFLPSGGRSDHRFDGGFTWLLNHNCMIDLSGGIGLTANAPDWFLSAGISYRVCIDRKHSFPEGRQISF